MKEVASQVLWAKMENGLPVDKIAQECGVDHSSIVWRLRCDDEARYKEIMARRRREGKIWKTRIPDTVIIEVGNRLENGEPLTKLSKEHGIDRKTVLRRLPRIIGEDGYRKIMNDRRRRGGIRGIPIAESILKEVVDRTRSGETLTKLASEYNVGQTTLRRRLPGMMGKREYKRAMRRIPPRGYGSPEAKQEGADSLLELRIKHLLEEHRIPFKFHETIEVGEQWYIPDFLLSNTIIEVAGLGLDKYWERYVKKIEDYLKWGYKVIVITPTHIYPIATRYLDGHEARLTRFKDFTSNIEAILGRVRTIVKNPISEEMLVPKKSVE